MFYFSHIHLKKISFINTHSVRFYVCGPCEYVPNEHVRVEQLLRARISIEELKIHLLHQVARMDRITTCSPVDTSPKPIENNASASRDRERKQRLRRWLNRHCCCFHCFCFHKSFSVFFFAIARRNRRVASRTSRKTRKIARKSKKKATTSTTYFLK